MGEETRIASELAGEMLDAASRTLGGLATEESDEARQSFVLGLRATAMELRAVLAAFYGPDCPRMVAPTVRLLQRAAATVVVLAEDVR